MGIGVPAYHTDYARTLADDANSAEARSTLDAQKQHMIDVTEAPYNATGDGATDDAPAINAAIQAADAADGYAGTIFFPPGTYALGSPIEIDTTGVRLAGHRAVFKPMNNTLETLIDIMATGSSMQMHFDGLLFSGYPVEAGGYTGVIIRATNGAFIDSTMTNCWFGLSNNTKAAVHARFFHSTIRNCVFEFGSVGILADDDVTTYLSTLMIDGCTFYEMSDSAVELTDPGSGNRHGSLMVSNTRVTNFDSAASPAFQFDKTTRVSLTNVEITYNPIGVNPVNASAIVIHDVNQVSLSNVRIIGDVARATSSESRADVGVYVYGPVDDLHISNSRISNARYGIRMRSNKSHVRVTNCLLEGGYNDGILIAEDASGSLLIADSVIQSYRQYLVDTRAGNDVNVVVQDSRIIDGTYDRGSVISASRWAGDGSIYITNSTFGKTDENCDSGSCITRTASDLHLFNNTFLGGITPYSGTGGYVNDFNEPISVRNGANSGGYMDLYEDSDNGSNYHRHIGASSMAGNFTWTYPNANPGSTQYLTVDTSGNLAYDTPAGSGDMTKAEYDALNDGFVDGNDTAYDATSWDSNPNAASMNAIRDKIETLAGGHDAVTLAADANGVLSLSTQEIGLDTQTANTILAGPVSGAAADPDFRSLVADDIPDLSAVYDAAGTADANMAAHRGEFDHNDIADGATAYGWGDHDGLYDTVGTADANMASHRGEYDHNDIATAIQAGSFTQDGGVLVGTGAGAYAEETGATLRTSLGLAIGTNVQAYDADLTTYAGITPSADIQTFLGYANLAAIKTGLSIDDLVTLSGVADGATHLGTFTGSTIDDSQTVKAALQALETAVEGAAGGGLSDIDDLPGDTIDDNLIDPVIGGTGIDASGVTDGQLLIGNSADNTFDLATLTDGVGIDIANGHGAIGIDVDTTEITGNQTWSDGATDASLTVTYDLSAGTDPVWTVSNGVMNLSAGELQAGGSPVVTDADIGTTVLAPDGDGSGLSGVVISESDPEVGAVTGIVVSDGAGSFSAAEAADIPDLSATYETVGGAAAVNFIIDGGGSAITTGVKGDLVIPFACTITGVSVLGDQSGSIVIDLWQGTIAEQIAGTIVDADSITAADPPTVSGAIGSDDDDVSTWDTSVNAWQVLRVNVDSCTTTTRVTLVLKLTKT